VFVTNFLKKYPTIIVINYGTCIAVLIRSTESECNYWKMLILDICELKVASSSSYICDGFGPLVDLFQSEVSRSLFKVLP